MEQRNSNPGEIPATDPRVPYPALLGLRRESKRFAGIQAMAPLVGVRLNPWSSPYPHTFGNRDKYRFRGSYRRATAVCYSLLRSSG